MTNKNSKIKNNIGSRTSTTNLTFKILNYINLNGLSTRNTILNNNLRYLRSYLMTVLFSYLVYANLLKYFNKGYEITISEIILLNKIITKSNNLIKL